MPRPLSEHGSDVRDRTLLHNSSHNILIRRRALQHKIGDTAQDWTGAEDTEWSSDVGLEASRRRF